MVDRVEVTAYWVVNVVFYGMSVTVESFLEGLFSFSYILFLAFFTDY